MLVLSAGLLLGDGWGVVEVVGLLGLDGLPVWSPVANPQSFGHHLEYGIPTYMASYPKTTGTTGTNQWGVKGVAKRLRTNTSDRQRAATAAHALHTLAPETRKENDLRRFASRWRVSKTDVDATGAKTFSERVEYLRAWSERGRNENVKEKRRRHAASILAESFPYTASELTSFIAVKFPPEHLQQEFTDGGQLKDHKYGGNMREETEKHLDYWDKKIRATERKQLAFDEKIDAKMSDREAYTAIFAGPTVLAASGAAMIAGVGAAVVAIPVVTAGYVFWAGRLAYRATASAYYEEKAIRIAQRKRLSSRAPYN
jgi:hypothetical protein